MTRPLTILLLSPVLAYGAIGTLTVRTLQLREPPVVIVPYQFRATRNNVENAITVPNTNGLPLLTAPLNYPTSGDKATIIFRSTRLVRNPLNPWRLFKGVTGQAVGGVGGSHIRNGSLINRRVLITASHHFAAETNAIVGYAWDLVGLNNEVWSATNIASLELTFDSGTLADHLAVLFPDPAPAFIEVPKLWNQALTNIIIAAGGYWPYLHGHASARLDIDLTPPQQQLGLGVLRFDGVLQAAWYAGVNTDWYGALIGWTAPNYGTNYGLGVQGGDSACPGYLVYKDELVYVGIGPTLVLTPGYNGLSYSNLVEQLRWLYDAAGETMPTEDLPVQVQP